MLSHSCTSSHRWCMLGVEDNRGGISKWFVLPLVKLNVPRFSGNHLETPPGSSSLLKNWKPQVWTCFLCVWLVNSRVTLMWFTNTPALTGKMPLQWFPTNLTNNSWSLMRKLQQMKDVNLRLTEGLVRIGSERGVKCSNTLYSGCYV